MTQKYKETDVYYIGYVTFKEIANCDNINSVNPLYLMVDKMIGHFEEKSGNKYLVLNDVDENKEVSKNIKKFGKVLKKKLKWLMVTSKKIWIWERFLKNMICHWINL